MKIELQNFLDKVAVQNKRLVLVTGVFDILHREHFNFLTKAKAEGDCLLVGIEADQRVRQFKGESRPKNSENIRKENLEKLGLVDFVVILPEDFGKVDVRENFIKLVRPQVLAVSSHSLHQEEKGKLMAKYGGKLKVVHQHNPAISTSKILEINGS